MIKLKTLTPQGIDKTALEQEYPFSNIAFTIHVFARHKNDYHLGPFFSDEHGVVTISKELLEISAEAERETGIMDYGSIDECYSLVEIRLCSENDLVRAISARQVWGLLGREASVWESKESLIERLKQAHNKSLIVQEGLGLDRLRDEWKDGMRKCSYDFFVRPMNESPS
jgi:hypothetical protein